MPTVIAASPSSVYRVLRSAGVLDRWNPKPSKKGTGFTQPLQAHEHWHIDVSYLNLGGTFYYLCSILDGYSRYIVHWDVRESMTEADIELIIQQAVDRYPGRDTADHLGQRAAVHRPGFQGIYPFERAVACAHLAVLPPEQR